jgi:hypothetical protein
VRISLSIADKPAALLEELVQQELLFENLLRDDGVRAAVDGEK